MTDLRDLHGADYVPSFEHSHRDVRLTRLLPLMTLNATDDVLDIGCGSGFLAPFVAPRVRSYLGIDFSPPFIQRAQSLYATLPGVSFRCVDIKSVADETPAHFGAVFALDVSEHVPDDDWLATLQSARRAIAPGGRFYLHTPNADFFLERMKARNLIIRQFPQHVAVRTVRGNAELITRAGFTILRALTISHYTALRVLDPLRHVPIVGPLFEARVFIEAGA